MTGPERTLAAERFHGRVNLAAGFLNALAVGAIGAGALIPAKRTPIDIAWPSDARIVVGLVPPALGHGVFEFPRSEDCAITPAYTS